MFAKGELRLALETQAKKMRASYSISVDTDLSEALVSARALLFR
jgi:hypothetical protein